MMKHGTILLALTCWSAAGLCAADLSIPASTGMRAEAGLVALSPDELAAIEGGDLLLDVDRNTQMMTVTRINPGNYDNIQCYSVKVTTSVVRQSEVAAGVPKGSIDNPARSVPSSGGQAILKQFPSGTANLSSVTVTQTAVTGPVIRTNAQQTVPLTNGGAITDTGYNIHYVDPAKGSNTLGCVGVQSQAGMAKVVDSLKVDNGSYAPGATKVQTVSVNSYTNGTPPPAATFRATETKPTTPPPAPSTPSSSGGSNKWFFGLF